MGKPCNGILLGIPVYNEQAYVTRVLSEVRDYADCVLVIDDGSTDDTPLLLAQQAVEVIRHAENRGYGRSMQDMLRWARFDGYRWLITMDCDEQHEPAAIPSFIEAIERGRADVISGSRYLRWSPDASAEERSGYARQLEKWILETRPAERVTLSLESRQGGFWHDTCLRIRG